MFEISLRKFALFNALRPLALDHSTYSAYSSLFETKCPLSSIKFSLMNMIAPEILFSKSIILRSMASLSEKICFCARNLFAPSMANRIMPGISHLIFSNKSLSCSCSASFLRKGKILRRRFNPKFIPSKLGQSFMAKINFVDGRKL